MNQSTVTVIRRRALYERVWATPIALLAQEWGLSDVGLAKLCKRHEIPRPQRGHWAKKAAGQTVTKDPLPRPTEDWEIAIERYEPQLKNPDVSKEREAIMDDVTKEAETIQVPTTLRGAHPLVSASLQALDHAERDFNGL